MSNLGRVVVTEDLKGAGAVVYWNMVGGAILVTQFKALLEAAGLKGLAKGVKGPGLATAIKRGLEALPASNNRPQAVSSGARLLVRPASTGWHLQEESELNGQLVYRNLAVVSDVEGDGAQKYKVEPSPTLNEVERDNLVIRLRDSINYYLLHLTGADVSSWLVDVLSRNLNALGLRDKGGMYFVPPSSMPDWVTIRTLLRNQGHQVYEIPAMRSDETVQTVLAAMLAEANALAEKIELELDTGELGTGAIETRTGKVSAMQAKLESYRQLLGVTTPAIDDRFTRLERQLTLLTLRKSAAPTKAA